MSTTCTLVLYRQQATGIKLPCLWLSLIVQQYQWFGTTWLAQVQYHSQTSIFFHAHAHLNSITQLLYYFQPCGAWYEIILHQPVCRRACLDVCLNMEWLQYVSLVFGLHTFGVEMIVFISLPFFESCLYLWETCASHICWFSSREARDYEIHEWILQKSFTWNRYWHICNVKLCLGLLQSQSTLYKQTWNRKMAVSFANHRKRKITIVYTVTRPKVHHFKTK